MTDARIGRPQTRRERRRLSCQDGFGYRALNNWGDGDLPAPFAEGDLLYLAEIGDNDRLKGMRPGYFVVTAGFSIDEGDGWYFRVANNLDEGGSDRLHVFHGRSDSMREMDYMAGFELVDTSDPEGLAKRQALVADGWSYEPRPVCPTCGSELPRDPA